jgi:hypothetical protein
MTGQVNDRTRFDKVKLILAAMSEKWATMISFSAQVTVVTFGDL